MWYSIFLNSILKILNILQHYTTYIPYLNKFIIYIVYYYHNKLSCVQAPRLSGAQKPTRVLPPQNVFRSRGDEKMSDAMQSPPAEDNIFTTLLYTQWFLPFLIILKLEKLTLLCKQNFLNICWNFWNRHLIQILYSLVLVLSGAKYTIYFILTLRF